MRVAFQKRELKKKVVQVVNLESDDFQVYVSQSSISYFFCFYYKALLGI